MEGLTGQALQKQLPDYIAKLKAEAGVEILDEKLKAVELPTPPAPPAAAAPSKPAKPAAK